MLKIYVDSVIIYFIIYMTTGICFRKEYAKARDKVRKELNDNSKKYGVIRTTLLYLIISFIPIIRLIGLVGKYWMVVDPDSYVKKVKEKEAQKNERNNSV